MVHTDHIMIGKIQINDKVNLTGLIVFQYATLRYSIIHYQLMLEHCSFIGVGTGGAGGL